MRLILVSLCALLSLCANGATITPASLSVDDVQSAVYSSTNGDTILLPVGTATWGTELTVTNSITIQGRGTNSTVLCAGSSTIIRFNQKSDLLAGVVGISFYGSNNACGVDFTSNYLFPRQARIGYCKFVNCGKSGVVNAIVMGAYGVVDHCSFVNCIRGTGATRGKGAFGQYNWDTFSPTPFGSTNLIYYENCHFLWNADAVNTTYAAIDCEMGGSYAVRYCIFDNSSPYYVDGFDFHGNLDPAAYWPTIYRGTVAFEIYSNTFSYGVGSSGGKFADIRGGSGLVYSNVITGTSAYIQLSEEDFYRWGYYPQMFDYVTNVYCWENYSQGTKFDPNILSTVLPGCVSSTNAIHLGVEYFTNAPVSFAQLTYPHPLASPFTASATTTNAIIKAPVRVKGKARSK